MDAYEFDSNIVSGLLADDAIILPGLYSSPLKKYPLPVLAGVDEAGRGPLAGAVVAAAVILPRYPKISGLNDSKALSATQREVLYWEIKQIALAYSVIPIEAALVDELNIFEATMLAMRRAIQKLSLRADLVLVDGNQKPRSGLREFAIIKGDAKSASVMAASILAKVTRDQMMRDEDRKYPVYGFAEHKGYAVKAHLDALRKYGPCPIHRKSFEPIKSQMDAQIADFSFPSEGENPWLKIEEPLAVKGRM